MSDFTTGVYLFLIERLFYKNNNNFTIHRTRRARFIETDVEAVDCLTMTSSCYNRRGESNCMHDIHLYTHANIHT